ncbi:MAG: hypothetical protein ACI8PZ_001052 [Myxococcota bacterium]|jgi:hypothetical protein
MLVGCDWIVPLSDLRPEALVEAPIRAEDVARGRATLARAAVAHGGEVWGEHGTWEVVLEDRWSDDWLIQRRSPWPTGARWLRFQFVPGTTDGRVEFLDGPEQGTTWGLAGGRTYSRAPGAEPVWDQASAMASRLPTMQFLFEFPQRITEAPFIAHVGERQVSGRTAEAVFASWGSVAPDPHYDQFLVYVDAETDHILAIQYTVRKSGRRLLGHRFWSELQAVDGVVLPFFQTSLLAFDGTDPVHSFFVRELAFDTVPAAEITDPAGQSD